MAKPKENVPNALITFAECRHTVEFSSPFPNVGEILWCRRCELERTVLLAPHEYKIRCRGCRYSRRYGRAELTAKVEIAKHQIKTGHQMDLYDGRRLVPVESYQTVTPPLSLRDPNGGSSTTLKLPAGDAPQGRSRTGTQVENSTEKQPDF